jgi:methyl coenzyme M reductase subunit D
VLIAIHVTLSPEDAEHRARLRAKLQDHKIDVPDAVGHPWISIEGQIEEDDLDAILTKLLPPIDRSA